MEQNKKQTAVEFVIEKLDKFIEPGNQIIVNIILNQAKEMEKQQLKESWDVSCNEMHKSFSSDVYKRLLFNQYYKETYGTE